MSKKFFLRVQLIQYQNFVYLVFNRVGQNQGGAQKDKDQCLGEHDEA